MKKLKVFLEMIKFEHTIFALPFAYLGMVVAWGGWERASWADFLWISIAMGAARTAAMSLNRYVDRAIDARNPRTENRPIQAGKIGANQVLIYALLSLLVLAVAASQLNRWALYLFPGAIVFLVGYSYSKRFSWLCHYILGFTDGLAPMGGWVAVNGSPFQVEALPAWILLMAVTFWIGGFDIIYACQDAVYDRENGLHSIPARFGVKRGLQIAKVSHLLTLFSFIGLGWLMGWGIVYWIGVAAVGGLLIYEHSLVQPDDLSKLGIAFFNINSYISLTIFAATFVAVMWK